MKRKAYTVVVIILMLLLGAAYWVDLSLFINPNTGFVEQGPLWLRYLLLAVVLALAVLGLRGVSPRAIGVLRVKQKGLAVLFGLAGASGIVFGGASTLQGVPLFLKALPTFAAPGGGLVAVGYAFALVPGVLFLWYGVWMLLAARQLFARTGPSPTKGAGLGIFAALPFCMQTVYRVLVKPSSVYRLSNIVRIFTALCAMLWLGMLLRALYIALVRRRVRWMYLLGLVTFLFATLEFVQTLHGLLYGGGFQLLPLLEGINTALLGVATAGASLAIAGQGNTAEAPTIPPPKPAKNIYRRAQF